MYSNGSRLLTGKNDVLVKFKNFWNNWDIKGWDFFKQ